MRGFVGNTDFDWFTLLSQSGHDEVNFWRPSGSASFKALAPGQPLLFRLKAPHRAIAGFGFFERYVPLPDWLTWETFGTKNGVKDWPSFSKRIAKYRRANAAHLVGCILLSSPVFLPRELWVAQPEDWKDQIVSGKGYDLSKGVGARVWAECMAAAQLQAPPLAAQSPRWSDPIPTRRRLGQGTFRAAITDAYDRACAVTQEHSLPVLEAAHIRPYSQGGEHVLNNGLLLRSDLHRLFDRGYVGVDSDHRFLVSDRLRADFDNGKTYYAMQGQQLVVPRAVTERPDAEALEWHRNEVFLG
jgi:putative restriction endonuclease